MQMQQLKSNNVQAKNPLNQTAQAQNNPLQLNVANQPASSKMPQVNNHHATNSSATSIEAIQLNQNQPKAKRLQVVQLAVNFEKSKPDNLAGKQAIESRAKMVFNGVAQMAKDGKIMDNRPGTVQVISMPELFLNDTDNPIKASDVRGVVTSLRAMAADKQFEGMVFAPGTFIAMHPAVAAQNIKPQHLETIAKAFDVPLKDLEQAYQEMTDATQEKYEKLSEPRRILAAVGDAWNKKLEQPNKPRTLSIENELQKNFAMDDKKELDNKAFKIPKKLNTMEEFAKVCKSVKEKPLVVKEETACKLVQNATVVIEGGPNGKAKIVNKMVPSNADSRVVLYDVKDKHLKKQYVSYPAQISVVDPDQVVDQKMVEAKFNDESNRFSAPKTGLDMAVAICLDYGSSYFASVTDHDNKASHVQVLSAGLKEWQYDASKGSGHASISGNDLYGRVGNQNMTGGGYIGAEMFQKDHISVSMNIKDGNYSFIQGSGKVHENHSKFPDTMVWQVSPPVHHRASVASSVASFDGNTNVGVNEFAKNIDEESQENLTTWFPKKPNKEFTKEQIQNNHNELMNMQQKANQVSVQLDCLENIRTNNKIDEKSWNILNQNPDFVKKTGVVPKDEKNNDEVKSKKKKMKMKPKKVQKQPLAFKDIKNHESMIIKCDNFEYNLRNDHNFMLNQLAQKSVWQ
ncbi:hypothetical protein [Acanthopleuribacter pedis]|uniref:HTH cro/C1-type domain-containing protein n=1 Tax=Acanthopleuribacter pedis TaxID=442870 RepID=A0A8J7QDU1_9BACT|nr:hypothetical protein [Acanthopleuribacter pedis]MBO1322329.1 hypothetical protein [Acanthopleuribacter pedis]